MYILLLIGAAAIYIYVCKKGITFEDDGWRRGCASILATQPAPGKAKECTEQEGTEAIEGPHPRSPTQNPV